MKFKRGDGSDELKEAADKMAVWKAGAAAKIKM